MNEITDHNCGLDTTRHPENIRMFRNFVDEYGPNYTQKEFLKFLKKRYVFIIQQTDPLGKIWLQENWIAYSAQVKMPGECLAKMFDSETQLLVGIDAAVSSDCLK